MPGSFRVGFGANGIRTLYIEPGSPWQNGFVEGFHRRFRDECTHREQLNTLTEAWVVIGDDRREYDPFRPPGRPGYLSPAGFAREQRPPPTPFGLRPPSTGDGLFEAINQPSTHT